MSTAQGTGHDDLRRAPATGTGATAVTATGAGPHAPSTTPGGPADATTGAATAPLLATTVPAPAGDLTFVLTPEDGVVRVAGFSPLADVAERIPASLAARGLDVVAPEDVARYPTLEPVVRAVQRYTAGEVAALDDVPVEQPGGPFFQRAWAAMRAIPAGATSTYAELAAAAGSPLAGRAAGSACAKNLVAPFVPCHRVLRTGGGALGGYYFGLDAKRALLSHEGAPAVATLAAPPGLPA